MATGQLEHHKVLLTGATGFIGNHILSKLLESGSSVRATVRSELKIATLRQCHSSASESLDFAVVSDMTAPGSFSEAFRSQDPITTVIHTASPFLYKDVHRNSDLLNPAIQGTLRILEAAHETPSVRRVIITGSIAAVVDYTTTTGTDGTRKMYSANDWNPISWDKATTAEDKPTAYRASKTFAERKAWDFMKRHNPIFDLVVLLPPMVYGPPLWQSKSFISDLNESNLRVWNLFLKSSSHAPMPPNGVHHFVDVRDLADAHLQALLRPLAGNKRLIVSRGPVTSQRIADILRTNLPELEHRTPLGVPGANTLPKDAYLLDSETAADILGLAFRDIEDTFVDLGRYLLDSEKASK